MPACAVLLIQDETTLRLLPPLRAAWALKGQQAEVAISGRNDQRVLFGAINPNTGHRIVLCRKRARQEDFGAFLREVRRRYRERPVWLLIDRGPSHTARKNLRLAGQLNITLIWLPRQCSELNAMDHIWRFLKNEIAANRQFPNINELSAHAEQWLAKLGKQKALRLAGLLSPESWLRF